MSEQRLHCWFAYVLQFSLDLNFNVWLILLGFAAFSCCIIVAGPIEFSRVLDCVNVSRSPKNDERAPLGGQDSTSSNVSLSSATHLPSFLMSHVAQMPASPGSILRVWAITAAPPVRGARQCFLPWKSIKRAEVLERRSHGHVL